MHQSLRLYSKWLFVALLLVTFNLFTVAQTEEATPQKLPTATQLSTQEVETSPTALQPTQIATTDTDGDIKAASVEWSWPDFGVNFLSNILSTILLGVFLFAVITQPRERRRKKKRQLQFLGMLYGELRTNHERVKRVIELLEPIEDMDSKPLLEKLRARKFGDVTKEEARLLGNELPHKYTRGIWNALKEERFITQLDESPTLIFGLLRANEAMVIADTSRRTLRTELLKGSTDIDGSVNRALVDSKNLNRALDAVLPLLAEMNLPEFPSEEIALEEDD